MKTTKLIGIGALALLVAITTAQTHIAGKDGVLGGKGIILAKGEGSAQMEGNGRFVIHGAGKVQILVDDKDELRVEGFELEKKTGDLRTYSGEGAISLDGDKVRVEASGSLQSIRIIGHGEASFKGKGEYRGGGATAQWKEEGVTLTFGKKDP